MNLTVPSSRDPDVFATLEVADGLVRARLYRRRCWRRQPSGRPGPAANRPPREVTLLLAARRYDAPLHLVASRVCDDLAAGATTLSETIDAD